MQVIYENTPPLLLGHLNPGDFFHISGNAQTVFVKCFDTEATKRPQSESLTVVMWENTVDEPAPGNIISYVGACYGQSNEIHVVRLKQTSPIGLRTDPNQEPG